MLFGTRLTLSNCMTSTKVMPLDYISSGASKVGVAACLCKTTFGRKQWSPCFSIFAQPCLMVNFKRMTWSVRSSINGSSFSPSTSNGTNGGTRIIRVIQEFQNRLGSKIQEVKKNLPMKLLFFLIGFYCATAFATVIGQTGDWDILSAGLAVVVVEGIGALMYRASLPLVSKGTTRFLNNAPGASLPGSIKNGQIMPCVNSLICLCILVYGLRVF